VSASTNPVKFEGLISGTTDTRVVTTDTDGVLRYKNITDISSTQGSIGKYSTSGITTSSTTLNKNYNYYGVNNASNTDLILPSPVGDDGFTLIIKDEGGYAGTYRIRLTSASGNIDGNSYVDMNINYMSLTFMARNNNWWII
jgi:hypothetical protein